MIFHIGEAAALMFLAYMVGWAVGYFARRLSSRASRSTNVAATAPAKTESSSQSGAASESALAVDRRLAEIALPEVIPRPLATEVHSGHDVSVADHDLEAIPTPSRASPPASAPDAVWLAMQTSTPVYRPAVSATSEPPPLPDDPDDVILLKRPAAAQAAATPLKSTAAGPALRPGLAWFGDINGHPAPPHDSLLGRQSGGANAIRLAAKPQQLTARPNAPSAPVRATEPVQERKTVVADTVPPPVIAPSPTTSRAPAEVVPSPQAAVTEEPSAPVPHEPPPAALAVEPVQSDPANVEWEELPTATPVVPPPARPAFASRFAAASDKQRSPLAPFGRSPAPAVVDADAMLSAMLKDTPAREAEEVLSGEQVAPPLSEIIAQQASQLAAIQENAPPPDVKPVPPPDVQLAPPPSVQPATSRPAAEAGQGDAARNAVEGGWSRRRVRAIADRPELIDVTSAVAAAQSAVQQVLAQAEPVPPPPHHPPGFGKPPALQRPRDGRRDSLREIIGVTSLDESTLNNLGIFHYDQIAAWTDAEVLWLENHVFARGRVGREKWQDQAQKLVQRRPSPPRVARS